MICVFGFFLLICSSMVRGYNCDILSCDLQKLASIASRHNAPMPGKSSRLVLAHTRTWELRFIGLSSG